MGKNEKVEDLDELWEFTGGTQLCPSCESVDVYGHITKIRGGFAFVDWVCEACGFKWSGRHPFEEGCLDADEDCPDGFMILSADSGDDNDLPKCCVRGCGHVGRYGDPSKDSEKVFCRFHALYGSRAKRGSR